MAATKLAAGAGLVDAASKLRGMLWGVFCGDAVAMPVHWYYDRDQLFIDFPPRGVTGYHKSVASFPGSIMNLSNTGGGGRGSYEGSIVGDVILHGKKHLWRRGAGVHYHATLQAGENTLEAQLARVLIRGSLAAHKAHLTGAGGSGSGNVSDEVAGQVVQQFAEDYVAFMTTPGTHNDAYAATAHRMFFANYVAKIGFSGNSIVPAKQPQDLLTLADNDGHNVDAIDGLTCVPAVLAACVAADPAAAAGDKAALAAAGQRAAALAKRVINVTRRTRKLDAHVDGLCTVLSSVLGGASVRDAVTAVAATFRLRLPRLPAATEPQDDEDDPMVACYIDSSFPALLYYAYKYGDGDPVQAVLRSANGGGENVARGALMGAIVGARWGVDGLRGTAFPRARPLDLVAGLVASAEIAQEIEALVG